MAPPPVGAMDAEAVKDLLKKLEHGTQSEKSYAISNLWRVPPDSATVAAIPILIKYIRSTWDPHAIRTLAGLPFAEESVQVLRDALNSQNCLVSRTAAQAIPTDERYLSEITSGLQHADSDVRAQMLCKFSASTFVKTDSWSRQIMPLLIAALRDNEYNVRRIACLALAQVGSGVKEAGPALIEILKNERHSQTRHSAAKALVQTGGATVADLPLLIERMRTDTGDRLLHTRACCAQVIGQLGEEAREAVPDLAYVIETDKDSAVREAALEALANMGAAAQSALPQIIQLVKIQGTDIRRHIAVDALGKIANEDNHAAFDTLIACLEERNENLQSSAVRALGRFRNRRSEVLEALTRVTFVTGSPLEKDLRDALQDAGVSEEEAFKLVSSQIIRDPLSVDVLVEELKDADWLVRNSGLEKIYHQYVPVNEVLVPHLVTALNDPELKNRYRAVQLLKRAGPSGKIAVTALLESMKHGSDYNIKRWSMEALVKIDRENPLVLTALNEAMLEPRGVMNGQCASELALAGSQGLPYLLDALNSDDAGAIFAAAPAIGTLGDKARNAIPALLRLARENRDLLCVQPTCGAANSFDFVLHALASIAPGDEEVLKTLTSISQEDDASIRQSAIRAMAKIENPQIKEALAVATRRNHIASIAGRVNYEVFDVTFRAKQRAGLPRTAEASSLPPAPAADLRRQILAIIASHAVPDTPWQEACDEPMRENNITVAEVETEVRRRAEEPS